MNANMRVRNASIVILLAAALMELAIASSDISGFAHAQDDGSLQLSGYIIHLSGIYVPPTGQTCYTFIRPPPCGSRASLALNFEISGKFTHCTPLDTNADDSVVARCSDENVDDLSAWMLQRGWAVATPDAPFEYATMEKIAQSKGIGIWGIPVEVPRLNRHRRPPSGEQ
jgi:endonuclease YncB( thermonuclease family)